MRFKLIGRAILFAVCLVSPAGAGTVTDTFDVTLTIQAGCEVSRRTISISAPPPFSIPR